MARLHARVRQELGEDAVILGTRTLHRDDAAPLIEMTAGLPEEPSPIALEVQHTVIETTLKRAEFAGRRVSAADFDTLANLVADEAYEGTVLSRDDDPIPAGPPTDWKEPEWLEGYVEKPSAQGPQQPDAQPATAVSGPWEGHQRAETEPVHAYRFGPELVEAGLTHAAVDAIAEYAPDASNAHEALAATLARPVRYPREARTATISVQGPAGSGKTTALMRMALDCAESGRETILVAADGTRAAAREQVHHYAESLGLQSVDSYGSEDLEVIVSRATQGACLFVDVGPGPWKRPSALLAEHFAYRALPSHWDSDAARLTRRGFADGSFAGCIPTFTDLVSGLHPVLSQALEARLGLAFLSSNRDVSTGIALADPRTLASGVLQIGTRETSDGRVGASA